MNNQILKKFYEFSMNNLQAFTVSTDNFEFNRRGRTDTWWWSFEVQDSVGKMLLFMGSCTEITSSSDIVIQIADSELSRTSFYLRNPVEVYPHEVCIWVGDESDSSKVIDCSTDESKFQNSLLYDVDFEKFDAFLNACMMVDDPYTHFTVYEMNVNELDSAYRELSKGTLLRNCQ